MNFSYQIKQLRQKNNYTQSDLGEQLNVSRQTISSWENDRNLPDLEMVVLIAKTFDLSLDQLILGDDGMENKLIKDGHEGYQARHNILAGLLFVSGAICLILKAVIGVKITADGLLHEPFFLLPLGYLLIFMGLCYSVVLFSRPLLKRKKKS